LSPETMPIPHRPALPVCLAGGRRPRLEATNSHTISALHCHWVNLSAETDTLLTSLRLSQTMKDDRAPVVAGSLCTGMTQLSSHPGHTALSAGRVLIISLWDFMALIAAPGHCSNSSALTNTAIPWHDPTRRKSSYKVSIGVIHQPLSVAQRLPPVPWAQVQRPPACLAVSARLHRI